MKAFYMIECTYEGLYMYIRKYACRHVFKYIDIDIDIYIYTYIHEYIYIYIYIYIHIYMFVGKCI